MPAISSSNPGSSVWPYLAASSIDTTAGSGSGSKTGTVAGSDSLSRSEHKYRIFVAEDNRADVFLLREALASAGVEADLEIATDGENATNMLDAVAVCYDLVILDLNLPKRSGFEILQHLREAQRCSSVNVLIMTSSDSEQDRERTRRLGANAYFRKPTGYDAFLEVGGVVKRMLQ